MKKVWVNGTFDVLHVGHIKLLEYASSLGSVRVGLDTDDRIKKNKGQQRPINPLSDRIFFMESIRHVSDVVYFSTDEELSECIKNYEPDYFVIGSDYVNRKIIGREFAKEIIFFDRLDYSSTDTISKIIKNYEKENLGSR